MKPLRSAPTPLSFGLRSGGTCSSTCLRLALVTSIALRGHLNKELKWGNRQAHRFRYAVLDPHAYATSLQGSSLSAYPTPPHHFALPRHIQL